MTSKITVILITLFLIGVGIPLTSSNLSQTDNDIIGCSSLNDITQVSVQPFQTIIEEEGQVFSVSIYVEPTEPIVGVDISLFYNPNIIHANSVTESDLFDNYLMFDSGNIDNVNGVISDVCILAQPSDAVSDTGSFVDIEFTVQYVGSSPLDLEEVVICNITGAELPVEVHDGEVIPLSHTLTINVIGCGTTDPPEGSYPYGTVVYIEAFPCSHWEFAGWSGDIVSMDNPTCITMDDDHSITANFDYMLPIEIIACGNVTKNPDRSLYPVGDNVELIAIPDDGWSFAGWTGDISSSDNPTILTIQSSMTDGVIATFTEGGNTPEISDVILIASEPLDTDPGFGFENVSATVTDIFGIGEVKLIVTDPDDIVVEYPMVNIVETDTYYVNTTFTIEGCYQYHVWADDIYNSENTSSSQQFEIPANEDIDLDGQIQFMDLVAVVIMYGDEGPPGWVREDVDNDGQAQFMDLVQIVLRYGEYWSQC